MDYDFFDEHVWPSLAHRIPSMEAVKVLRAWAGFYDYNTVDQNLIIGESDRCVLFVVGEIR